MTEKFIKLRNEYFTEPIRSGDIIRWSELLGDEDGGVTEQEYRIDLNNDAEVASSIEHPLFLYFEKLGLSKESATAARRRFDEKRIALLNEANQRALLKYRRWESLTEAERRKLYEYDKKEHEEMYARIESEKKAAADTGVFRTILHVPQSYVSYDSWKNSRESMCRANAGMNASDSSSCSHTKPKLVIK